MANNDWGRPDSQPAPRRSGNWLWLVLGFIVLMTLLTNRAPQQAPPDQTGVPPLVAPVDKDRERPAASSRPGIVQRDGDWSLEAVPVEGGPPVVGETSTPPPGTSAKPAAAKKTSQGDWDLEEVTIGGEPGGADAASRSEGETPSATRSKKSMNDDWSIEEVETKK